MQPKHMLAFGASLSLVVTLLIAGCPQQQPTPSGDPTALTSDEENAVIAAVAAIEALSNAGATAQAGTDEDNQTAQTNDCPAVAFTAGGSLIEPLSVTIDFGAGCDAFGSDDYFCAGSTTGMVNILSRSLTLAFNTLACNGSSLTGSAGLQFTAADPLITMTGDFDLGFDDGSTQVVTDGEGTVVFDRNARSSSIPDFAGNVEFDSESHALTLTNIGLSFTQFGNYIPFEGEAVLSTNGIRTTTVQFDISSPTSGVVQVSVDGGAFFEVNIFQL